MEQLNDLFDEFDEQQHAPERAATERKLQQEAETKRAFDVGRNNLLSLVIPVVEALVVEVSGAGRRAGVPPALSLRHHHLDSLSS